MKAVRQHIDSLDVFRGLAVAAMILVNNPGNWGAVYPPLVHANWNGATLADVVFPELCLHHRRHAAVHVRATA